MRELRARLQRSRHPDENGFRPVGLFLTQYWTDPLTFMSNSSTGKRQGTLSQPIPRQSDRWGAFPQFQLRAKTPAPKSNESAPRPVKKKSMHTIKGLAVLALVAAAVFILTARNDMKSEARYAARMHSPALEKMAGQAIVHAAGSAKPATLAAHKTGTVAKVASKAAKQTPPKIPAA